MDGSFDQPAFPCGLLPIENPMAAMAIAHLRKKSAYVQEFNRTGLRFAPIAAR
jgi:hypothetical protein